MTAAPSPPTVRGDSSTNLAHPGRNACAHTKPGNPGCPDREDGKHRAGNRKAEANRGRKRAVTFSADTRGSEQDGEQHRASLKAGQREARSVPTVQHAVAKGAKRANDRAETRIPRLSFASPFSKARTAGRPRSNTDVRVDHASVDPSGNRSELHVNKRVATDQIPTQQVTDGLSPQVEAAKVPEASTRISPDSMPAGQQVPEASADASSDQITYSHSDLTQRDNQDSDWPNLPLSELGDKGMIPGKVLGSRALGNTGAASNWPLMSMPQTGGASRLPSKLLAMGRGTRGRVVGAQYAPPRPRFANAIMSRSARSALQEESGQFEDAASDYDNVALSHTKDSATEDRVKDGSAQTVGSVTDSAKDESTSASNGVEQIKGSEASAHASPVMRRSALSDTTGNFRNVGKTALLQTKR